MQRPFEDCPVQVALKHVEAMEGFRANAYKCPAGIWTIGYGHTADVVEGAGPLTHHEAEELLERDLEDFKDRLAWHIKVPVSEPQFIALLSLCYNVGVRYLTQKCPKLMKALNSGDYEEAANQFLDITSGGMPGLVKRRKLEANMMRTY